MHCKDKMWNQVQQQINNLNIAIVGFKDMQGNFVDLFDISEFRIDYMTRANQLAFSFLIQYPGDPVNAPLNPPHDLPRPAALYAKQVKRRI